MKNTLLVITFLFFFSLESSYSQENRLTPENLWEMGRVSMDDVSSDGEWVLYGVTYYDIEENSGSRDLYLVKARGGDPIQLTNTPESEYNGQFLPDGDKVAYLKDGFLWEIELDGTNQNQVGYTEMNGFEYAPSGGRILFTKDIQYDKTVNDLYKDLPKADARIIDDLMYRHWNAWHDYKYSNILTVPYQDGRLIGEPINIINGPFDAPLNPFGGMEQITFSPDGKQIAYTCKKLRGKEYAESTDADVYVYDIQTAKTLNISEGMEGYDMEPVFSSDGRYIAWNSMETPGFESDRNRIFIYDTQKNTRKELTKGLDQSANHPTWSKDGKTIYFNSDIEATKQLFAVEVSSGKVRQITKGTHNYYGFAVAGENLVASRASMSIPHELYQVNPQSGQATALTSVNKAILSTIEMGKVDKRWIKTTDGKEMLVWMIYPPGFDEDKKYPALLYCQGGPQSAVSQFWSYRWNFQMMAANDYIIVAPNRRGLPSFGREWNDQISGDWGGQAMQDLLTAIDEAKKESYIDKDRLGAVGASFGGYSVYWLAGNHDKRFKTFISHCGLFNLESWYGTTEELFFANQDLEGPYWAKKTPESYVTDSPHKFVRNWDTPILVIHGEKDFRVPIGEGMQAFQAAQLNDIPSRFLYFPNEGHWVGTPQNSILWQRVFFDWLDQWLKPESKP